MGDDPQLIFSASDVQRIAAEAVATAMANVSRPSVCVTRKPDLPPFDPTNVLVWIQRIEASYARASIVKPEHKFAFLEAIFSVDANPKVNEFLFGSPSADNWEAFLAYLRSEYGRTRRQMAATLAEGVRRDGLRPSQLFAKIVDLSKDATVDDVRKEILIKELPQDVLQALAQQLESATGDELATLADHYFDQDGRNLHSSSSSINTVAEPVIEFTTCFNDNNDNVSHVDREGSRPSARFKRSKSRTKQKTRSPSKQRQSSNNNNDSFFAHLPQSSKRRQSTEECFYHFKHGQAAQKCMPSCKHYSKNEKGRGRM